jgi:hypothetical protein
VTEGEAVASSTRGPGRRLREDGGADRPGPRAERARKEGAGAEKAAGADGRARQGRERKGGRGARAGLAGWAERPRGGGVVGFFSFFFYSGICFLFSFYLLYLIQIQMSHKFKLAFLRIMHQTKVGFRV